jgi:hypothetical protein
MCDRPTQTKAKAIEAAKSQMRAANASLKAVEEGIQLHANNRDYAKLKEIAEASGLAAKVGTSHDSVWSRSLHGLVLCYTAMAPCGPMHVL